MEIELSETYNEGQKEEYSIQFVGDYDAGDDSTGWPSNVYLGQILFTTPKLDKWVDVTQLFFEALDGQFDVEAIEERMKESVEN